VLQRKQTIKSAHTECFREGSDGMFNLNHQTTILVRQKMMNKIDSELFLEITSGNGSLFIYNNSLSISLSFSIHSLPLLSSSIGACVYFPYLHDENKGSGKEYCYSSSTQKQSVETVATSRNPSCKQLSKHYTDLFAKSPSSIYEMGTTTSRNFNDINNDCTTKNHVSSSMKMIGSEINVYPDVFINEIQLNIYPPSALYTAKPTTSTTINAMPNNHHGKYDDVNCLSIDIHENNNKVPLNESINHDDEGKSLSDNFSHISLKRCDSILHISIGNSSKIVKRSRRKKRWLFTKLFRLSRTSKNVKRNNQMYFSPQYGCSDGKEEADGARKDGIYNLNQMEALNVINDNLVITINKKRRRSETTPVINQLSLFEGDLGYGANELDFYMNEIRKREYSG
jgi:hypothetical protein